MRMIRLRLGAATLALLILPLLAPGAEAQVTTTTGGATRPLSRIDPPRPNGCLTAVTPGDHTFSCDGITYLVMIDEQCTRSACGLIFDIHGASMSGAQMRNNTNLHVLAPKKGYLVVHPSAAPSGPGTWSFDTSGPNMAAFMMRMIETFQVDRARIHVTGFSMGAAMTFWFLCNHNGLLASTAVVTGSSADQVRAPTGDRKCIDAIDAAWQPRVPILFMNGTLDPALRPEAARARTEGIVSRLSLTGGTKVAGDGHFTRTRWTGTGGMVFDFIEHDYSAQQERLGGHCMPGGTDSAGTTCTKGDITLHWGETALQWFIEHPKK